MKRLLITLPCYNEEQILEKNAHVLLDYISRNFTSDRYDWRLLIIDNASSDGTFELARKLSKENPAILVAQCEFKGRGVALRTVWSQCKGYDIVSYMDVDLSADLKDFKVLINKIEEGFQLAVGSRYVPGADIRRNPKREFLSRIYNLLLKTVLGVKFRDAQCGFKAFDGTALEALLPDTTDSGWFWDTELMILAERKGYRIVEVPVTWQEVRDELRKSKVSPFVEIARQLKNIYSMRMRLRKL